MQYSVSKSKKLIVEYVWLGLDNEIFSKTRILSARQLVQNRSGDYIDYKEIPDWDFDGSSTRQATTEASEVILKPCALYKNPFLKDSQSFIVLCSTYTPDGTPLKSNTRDAATQIFDTDAVIDQDIWFGIEFFY
jgi:glutamine synthetase